MIIQQVQNIAQVWDKVEGFIENAFQYTDDYQKEHAQVYLSSGSWMLLIAIDDTKIVGCAVVSFINYPTKRVAFIIAIGGRFIGTKDNFSQLKDLMKRYGATHIEGCGRKSIVRLWSRFGFKEKYTNFEIKI